MALKTKKITLQYHPASPITRNGVGIPVGDVTPYKVVRIEHTTEYPPGTFLSKATVDELNMSPRWHVVVVEAKP